MAGVDLQLGGQLQQPLVQRVVQAARHLALAPCQVRAADGADEQRVAGEHEPWRVAAPLVGDQQAHAVGRVAGRVQHPYADVADVEDLLVVQGLEVEVHELARRLV